MIQNNTKNTTWSKQVISGHPQSFPSAVGTVSYRRAVHQVSFLQGHSTQYLLTREVDGIVDHAIVEAQLGDHTRSQVANVLQA